MIENVNPLADPVQSPHRPRRAWLPARRAVVAVTTTVGLSLVVAACGGSPANHVAQLSTTTVGTSTSGGSATSQTRAYASCMRSHGVSDFPDPTSTGQISKTEVVAVRKENPSQFNFAESACGHLLPSGGGNGETQAQIAQDWTAFREFAQCMRSHGVSNWPDPTSRSASDNRPAFAITALGLDGNSPQLRAKAQQCVSLLHLDGLPAAH